MRCLIVLISFVCAVLQASGAEISPGSGLSMYEIEMPGDLISIPPLSICSEDECMFSDKLVIINESRSIDGRLHCSNGLAGYVLNITVYEFDLNGTRVERLAGTDVLLNETGYARFFIDAAFPAGLYALLIRAANSSCMIMPIIVAKGDMDLKAPARIEAGGLAEIEINTSAGGNSSKIFGAVMISRDDYYNASLRLSDGMNSTVSMGNNSVTLPGIPSTLETIMGLLYIFPPNSTVGMVESTDRVAYIQMITDPDWKPGRYILICGVYSPEDGILGINQREVEVV